MKNQAARALSDEITAMSLKAERAGIALQEVNDEYFSKYDMKSAADRQFIAIGYDRYKIFCDIVSDYLFEIRKTLEALHELGEEAAGPSGHPAASRGERGATFHPAQEK